MSRFLFKSRDDFDCVRSCVEAEYAAIGSVYCPYLKSNIAFNEKGIRHLLFKRDGKARPLKDSYPRLKLVVNAPEVLKLSRTLQGVLVTRRFEKQKINSRWEFILKDVTFYEFIAVIDSVRIKVIVKHVVGGEPYFWSVIPFWKTNIAKSGRLLYDRSLEIESEN